MLFLIYSKFIVRYDYFFRQEKLCTRYSEEIINLNNSDSPPTLEQKLILNEKCNIDVDEEVDRFKNFIKEIEARFPEILASNS